jgi:hypothetical protein
VIEKELLHTVAGNENWYSHYGEQGGVSFKKKKGENSTTILSSNPIPGYISKEMKLAYKRYLHAHMYCGTVHNR